MGKKYTTAEVSHGDATVPTGVNTPVVENKADKFRRLANVRVPNVLYELDRLAKLFTVNYEWTPDQADRVVSVVKSAVDALADVAYRQQHRHSNVFDVGG